MPADPDQPDFDFTNGEGLTEEEMRARLANYAKAIQEEYETQRAATPEDEVVTSTKEFFRNHIGEAAAQIVYLANNAASETVRLNASKYVIEEANAKSDTGRGSEIDNLLEKLTKNTSAK